MTAGVDLTLWVLAGVSWVLTIYFGLASRRERKEARSEREEARKARMRFDSYLRANARLGEEVSMLGGRQGRVVEGPDGWTVEFILEAEPGAYQVGGSPADMKRSERREEE